MCTCRYTMIMLLDSKTRRLALTDGAQQNPLDLPDDAHLVHRITSGSWVCTECRHPIGCHGSGNDAVCIGVETPSAPPAEAAPSADAGGPYFHALEKIWCISHVLKFIRFSRPAELLRLAKVGYFWHEALNKYKDAQDYFAKIFNPHNRPFSARDVEDIWLQAVEILRQRDNFDAVMVDAMLSEMQNEIATALDEEDIIDDANMALVPLWKQSAKCAQLLPVDRDIHCPQGHKNFFAWLPESGNDSCDLHVSPKRVAQQRGSLAAAFRQAYGDDDHWLEWFPERETDAESVRPEEAIGTYDDFEVDFGLLIREWGSVYMLV